MNPPIRDKSHSKVIWQGVQTGVIDVIGSDHAPHTLEEKSKEYPDSPSGMPGVQTLLPIMLDFVNKNKLSIFDLVRLLCTNPCNIYKVLNKGRIDIGYDADLTVIDMNKEFRITNNWIQSKSKWTPYDNVVVKGMPIFTIVNGKVAMSENEVIPVPQGQKLKFDY
jgi:dihydroorotase